jgi:hypothetical protein
MQRIQQKACWACMRELLEVCKEESRKRNSRCLRLSSVFCFPVGGASGVALLQGRQSKRKNATLARDAAHPHTPTMRQGDMPDDG